MSEEKVTLNDLAEGAVQTATPTGMPVRKKLDASTVKEANLAEAVVQSTPEPVVGTGNPMLDKAFEGLESAIERTQQETNETYQKGLEERIEASLDTDEEGDIDSIGEEETATTVTPQQQVVVHHDFDEEVKPDDKVEVKTVDTSAPVSGTKKETISMVTDTSVYDEDEHLFDGIDDEDFKLLDEEDDNKESDSEEEEEKAKMEAIKQNIRQQINKNFNPVHNSIDISKFTIAKKPINAAKVINEIQSKPIECADGVLWATKKAIRMSAWSPMEIQSIDPQRLRQGNYNKYIDNKLRLIYQHLIDANKPKSFEAWARMTPNTTVDDYMFTAYKATFGLSNILTYSCSDENCSNVFMEPVPIHSMIKFNSDEVKEQYMQILHEGNTDSSEATYNVDLYQISDDYVFALKTPSLYNTYIEPTLVPQEFNSKYEDRLLLLSYIDAIYKIDTASQQLIPIDTKPSETDKTLTYKRRIKTFDTILKSLTSDQLMTLSTYTDQYDGGKLDDDGNLVTDISYIYPEKTCPKCGKKIEEQVVNPDNMLFTRHQLGLMKKI